MTACVINGKRCTHCCEAIHLPKHVADSLPTNNHPDAIFVLNNWEPISTDEAFKINPYLQETFSDEGAYFKCKMLTIDGCSVYDDRPDVCKGYPTYNHNIEDFVNKQPDYNPYCNMWPVIKVVNV